MNPNDPLSQKPNPYNWSPPSAGSPPQPARPMLAQPGLTSAWDMRPTPATPAPVQAPQESEDFDAVAPTIDIPEESVGQFIVTPQPTRPQPAPFKPAPPKPSPPPPEAPAPRLTIPIYSTPSVSEILPQPVRPPKPVTPIEPPVAAPIRPPAPIQPPEPTFVAKPEPMPEPRPVPQESGMFSEKRRKKSKKLPVFATAFSLLVLMATGAYFVNQKRTNNPVATTETQQETTQVAAVKGANTATSLEEATKNVQVVGDKMLEQIRNNTFDGAYILTSPKFQGVTTATQANDVFKALQPSVQQKDLKFQKALCYPTEGDAATTTLTNESLCGGIYGFKDPTAYQKYYYIVVVTDYSFGTIHSIRGFEVSAHTDATIQDALKDLLVKVKQQVDS